MSNNKYVYLCILTKNYELRTKNILPAIILKHLIPFNNKLYSSFNFYPGYQYFSSTGETSYSYVDSCSGYLPVISPAGMFLF